MLPYRLKSSLQGMWFHHQCRAVEASLPVDSLSTADVAVVTFVGRRYLIMYLAALKTFLWFLGLPAKVVVLDDGSLRPSDLDLLRAHVRGIEILPLSSVPPADCPKGNCWERLLLVCDLAQRSFVVQLDSDTLTTGPIPEVRRAIEDNQSFTLLGDGSFDQVETFAQASLRYGNRNSDHVQVLAEKAMGELAERDQLYYVRGNAGFAGFGLESFTRSKVERLSNMIETVVGQAWNQWGSEQVMSNLIVSNSSHRSTLPFPRYTSYYAHPHVDYKQSAFVHYIGTHRFDNNFYASQVQKLFTDVLPGRG